MSDHVKTFLDALHQRGIVRLGPTEHLMVQRLLRLRPEMPPVERRAAMASVLATHPEQWRQIAALFDQYHPLLEAHAPLLSGAQNPVSQPGVTSGRRGQHWWGLPEAFARLGRNVWNAPRWMWCGAMVVVLCFVLTMLLIPLLQPPAEEVLTPDPPPLNPQPPPEPPVTWSKRPFRPEQVKAVTAETEPPWRQPDVRDVLAVVLSALLVLLGLRWLWLPRTIVTVRRQRAGRQRATLERRRLSEQAERRYAPVVLTYQVEQHPPLDEQAIDDAADLLGRLFQSVVSYDLDVSATLSLSIDGGGRIVPVYAQRPIARELIVLVDMERGDHPWLSGVNWVLWRWQTLGVRFARFDYRFDPGFVTEHAVGNALSLGELARYTAGGPLLIISRTLSTRGYRERAGWLDAVDVWPVKTWLDLDPRPLVERPRDERLDMRSLAQSGLQRFPFSEAGLLALACYVVEDGQGVPSPAWPPLKPRSDPDMAEALPRWALLAALVPDATWDQLDTIRRHFPELHHACPTPRYVQRLIEWVAVEDNERNPESADGRTLVLSPLLVERLIRQQRLIDAGVPHTQRLETRGRQLLLQQLDATRPEDELLSQFWELKRVSHALYLKPEQALDLVAPLLNSAVETELLEVVGCELERDAALPMFDPGVRDRLGVVAGGDVKGLCPRELLSGSWRLWCMMAPVPIGIAILVVAVAAGIGIDLGEQLLQLPHTRLEKVVTPPIWRVGKAFYMLRDTLKDGSPGPEMIVIPPGTFWMGSPDDESGRDQDEKRHEVRLTQPFAIGKYEVTFADYDAFAREKGLELPPDEDWGRGRRPVINVSWDDAVAYAQWLSEQTGKRYRLPSEAQWEYMARAGSTTSYSFGDDSSQLEQFAVCGGTMKSTAPVGQKRPNAWGIYDIHGNVWEWVRDWYGGDYGNGPMSDPLGPRTGTLRVIRGGSWSNDAGDCRSALRRYWGPGRRYNILGFRVLREVE
jgi:formylglycine-generating enzyme required for sulfatase activity